MPAVDEDSQHSGRRRQTRHGTEGSEVPAGTHQALLDPHHCIRLQRRSSALPLLSASHLPPKFWASSFFGQSYPGIIQETGVWETQFSA